MKSEAIIKTGMCVSYDWQLLKESIPRIYDHSDVICLGLDINRKSWSGNKYEFDDAAFYSFIKEIDSDEKIDVYEDDFALTTLNKRENCNRHRTLMAERMGKGGWHVQVDADEYFLDFGAFVNDLLKLHPQPKPTHKPINVCCPFVPLVKKTSHGYLYVNFEDSSPEIIPMATNRPDYQRARQNGHFNHITPHYVIHETWARGEEELWYKINNWGHASEELKENEKRVSYYNLWKALDGYNYSYVRNFHPAVPAVWPSLGYCDGKNIKEFINNFPKPVFPLSLFELVLVNSRNVARLKGIIGKMKT